MLRPHFALLSSYLYSVGHFRFHVCLLFKASLRLRSHGTGRIFDRLKNWPFTLFARNRAILLLCSHGIYVPDEILTFVFGLTSCSCAEGYFQDPKWRQKRERLTTAAMRPKIRHLTALKEINILHGWSFREERLRWQPPSFLLPAEQPRIHVTKPLPWKKLDVSGVQTCSESAGQFFDRTG